MRLAGYKLKHGEWQRIWLQINNRFDNYIKSLKQICTKTPDDVFLQSLLVKLTPTELKTVSDKYVVNILDFDDNKLNSVKTCRFRLSCTGLNTYYSLILFKFNLLKFQIRIIPRVRMVNISEGQKNFAILIPKL